MATADSVYLLLPSYRGHKNHRFCIFSAFCLNGADGGKRIISGSEDGHLYVWDLQSRAILQKLEGHHGR